MDILLLILGFLCVVVGIFGSFLPVLPGPGISWIGLALLYFTDTVPANYWILGIALLITILISVLDYVIPAKGTKRFGGSSYGIWGTNIGLIVGILAPIPFGFIIGPFVGAFIGELIWIKNKTWGGNVKIKLEICNLRIYDDPYRAFKIYAA
ncbi:hypothetical protein D3C72_564980 [compost metagenome]